MPEKQLTAPSLVPPEFEAAVLEAKKYKGIPVSPPKKDCPFEEKVKELWVVVKELESKVGPTHIQVEAMRSRLNHMVNHES